ncbi:hypothetical protein [Streptomyces albicerus]|uniref:hypothetical protein n=1 Tax=Streptomyces albicerus TaxID=2569859 RepID=UPI00124B04FC|nr:hypothetical protein [Streptomyces albicerus]
MWPGEQPPGGAPNPRDQNPQHDNPYQQPGYQQPNPYQRPPGQWTAPTVPAGAPSPPPEDGGNHTKIVAIVTAATVVVAAAVTGFVLLGGDKDDTAGPEPTESPSRQPSSAEPSDPRGTDGDKPTIAGWKVVVNAQKGIAFDVPAEWALTSPSWVSYVSEDDDPEETPLVAMMAPAALKEKWCGADEDKDGSVDHTPLAQAGSKGNKSAKSTEEIARSDSANWVYGAFTQPDRTNVTTGPVPSYTTASGITGSLATSESSGVQKKDKCDSDGKATTFAFENSQGDFVSWSFMGAKGVAEEVPDATVRKILSTVRLHKDPSDS